MQINQLIADELHVKPTQVKAAIELFDSGSTVPFVARYRKEATGALDDQQLRRIQERLVYLRELESRKQTVLKSLKQQGKLTIQLENSIIKADNKTLLEDIYQPYKTKRITNAQKARDAGLTELLSTLLENPHSLPSEIARDYLNPEKGYQSGDDCLNGAQAILVEKLSEQIDTVTVLRDRLWNEASFQTSAVKGKEQSGHKFRDYFDYTETIKTIPSHRMLAIFRGLEEGVIKLELSIDNESSLESIILRPHNLPSVGKVGEWIKNTVHQSWIKKLKPKLFKELMAKQREMAETEAIKVFGKNLKALLLSPPAGSKITLGLDPGIRTGVKAVVVDPTGKLLHHTTIYPHQPKNQWDQSLQTLRQICCQHQVELIAIGNGTASRETDKLISELLNKHTEIKAQKLIVSEAGASVYSASPLAAQEFPDLDVSLRGAVSIARRLQDPMAELVKIEPKAIGVGQYQHDVNQKNLSDSLEAVIEDCVNAVGVDLNSASEALLCRISGLNRTHASNIIQFRNEHGRFKDRNQLKEVPRLGKKAFEQSAAFLRINNSSNPLDGSGVHPESYSLAESIAKHSSLPVEQIIGDTSFLRAVKPEEFTTPRFGIYTVRDILSELEKPGRDPRPEFKVARLRTEIKTIDDLEEGMQLEGTVTNVTNFGAFIDIGVHQDGLVHISQLADKFVKDPHQVVTAGQIVNVRVTEIDLQRRRIALSMRTGLNTDQAKRKDTSNSKAGLKKNTSPAPGALAKAFAKAKSDR